MIILGAALICLLLGVIHRLTSVHVERLPMRVEALSDDGGTAVGVAQYEDTGLVTPWQPCVWTRRNGVRQLPLGSYTDGGALSCSADGAKIVGIATKRKDLWVVMWQGTAEPEVIAHDDSGNGFAYMPRTSKDGNWVVGMSEGKPFRWSRKGGLEILQQKAGSPTTGFATVVSPDGKAVAGSFDGDKIPQPPRSSIHVTTAEPATMKRPFINLGGQSESVGSWKQPWAVPVGMSGNGSKIVGNCWTHTAHQSFVWSASTGVQMLLGIGSGDVDVNGISADGNIIYGNCTSSADSRTVGTLWINGSLVPVNQYLATRGVGIPSDWHLESVTACSADGKVIAGDATDADGKQTYWIASGNN